MGRPEDSQAKTREVQRPKEKEAPPVSVLRAMEHEEGRIQK